MNNISEILTVVSFILLFVEKILKNNVDSTASLLYGAIII